MRPKTPDEIEWMRQGGQRLAKILQYLTTKVKPGVKPTEIAEIAKVEMDKAGLQAVLVGYEGYPAAMCISVNEAVVHGIPSKEPFADGDIVKLDLTAAYKGMVVDTATTVVCGSNANGDVKKLIDGTKKALEAGIAAIKGDGTRVGDISAAIQDVLDKNKLGIVRDLVGHGVGYGVHEDPNIPNYGSRGTGPALPAGATLAIEPMASLGGWQVGILKDGWTVVMLDSSLSAHFEHTVLITDNGAEILTAL